MQLNVTINLGDLWDEEKSVADILTDELRRQVIISTAEKIGRNKLNEMAEQMSDMVTDKISDLMRERVNSFMSEEIAISGRWGEKDFVGTIEDLMKKHFDETVFGPVDSNGKRLKGCTSSSMTYAEWAIKQSVKDATGRNLQYVKDSVEKEIIKQIKSELERHKTETIKQEVGIALNAILGK